MTVTAFQSIQKERRVTVEPITGALINQKNHAFDVRAWTAGWVVSSHTVASGSNVEGIVCNSTPSLAAAGDYVQFTSGLPGFIVPILRVNGNTLTLTHDLPLSPVVGWSFSIRRGTLLSASSSGVPDVNISQIGGASVSLGQKTMANSIPVAIASDQEKTGLVNPQKFFGVGAYDTDSFSWEPLYSFQGALTVTTPNIFTDASGVYGSGAKLGGVVDDVSPATVAENASGVARITPYRAQHVNLRSQAGAEIGSASSPIRTDPTGTTTQPVSGTVTANLGTLNGAATAANQTTGNATLGNIDTQISSYIDDDLINGKGKVLKTGVYDRDNTVWRCLEADGNGRVRVLALPDGAYTVNHSITAIGDGNKTVTTAGTRVSLASSTACKKVDIVALEGNTGTIVVGGSTCVASLGSRQGVPLIARQAYSLEIDNLNKVYLDATVSGEGVSYTYYN